MCLDEMAVELAHVGMIVDDHIAAHVMLRQPARDLLSPVGAGRAGRGHVQDAAGEPLRFQDRLQLGDGLAVSPGGRDDDIGLAARHDLVQHLNARGVQISVAIPSADRGQHTVDVEKDHPPGHRNAPRLEKRVSWLVMNSSSAACPLSVARRARAKAPAISSGRSTRSAQPPNARPRSAYRPPMSRAPYLSWDTTRCGISMAMAEL